MDEDGPPIMGIVLLMMIQFSLGVFAGWVIWG